MKYINLNRRGYGVLDLTREAAQCEIYHVETVDRRDELETLAAVLVSEAGNNVVRSESQALAIDSPVQFRSRPAA